MFEEERVLLVTNSLFVIAIVALLVVACEDNRPDSNQETAKSGFLTVYVDDQIADIVEPSLKLFSKEHPQAVLTVERLPAGDAVLALVSRDARLAVVARGLLPSEDTLLTDAKIVLPFTHIATDALVVIAHKAMPFDTLSDENLCQWLTGNRPSVSDDIGGSAIRTMICPPPSTSVFDNVGTFLLKGQPHQPHRLTSLPTTAKVVDAVRKDKTVLGVAYMSQVHTDSTIKMLRIGFTNEKGVRIYPQHVHLGYVVQKMYPYRVKIHTILRDKVHHFSLPAGVAGYIFQNAEAQRTFLDAGIVPEFAKLVLDPSKP